MFFPQIYVNYGVFHYSVVYMVCYLNKKMIQINTVANV